VSFDEDRAQIPAFLAQVAVGFPVLWDKGGDRHAEAFQVDRLPTALIVDRAGLVRFVHQGYDESEARRSAGRSRCCSPSRPLIAPFVAALALSAARR